MTEYIYIFAAVLAISTITLLLSVWQAELCSKAPLTNGLAQDLWQFNLFFYCLSRPFAAFSRLLLLELQLYPLGHTRLSLQIKQIKC